MAVDVMKRIRDHVLASSTVVSYVGSRVYAGEQLPVGYKPADGPAILFNVRGGGMAYHNLTEDPSIQYRIYGETLNDIWDTYNALKDYLTDAHGVYVASGRIETMGQQLVEPETDRWIYILCGFRHHVRDI